MALPAPAEQLPAAWPPRWPAQRHGRDPARREAPVARPGPAPACAPNSSGGQQRSSEDNMCMKERERKKEKKRKRENWRLSYQILILYVNNWKIYNFEHE